MTRSFWGWSRSMGHYDLPRRTATAVFMVGTAAWVVACSTEDLGTGTIRSPEVAPGNESHVRFSSGGKLTGGMDGYAWVAAGSVATVSSPNPCDESGCFTDTQKGLCTQGTIPALICRGDESSYDCNYAENWGVMVGLNPESSGGVWGDDAPRTLSIDFSGTPGNYRLSAHVAGDPKEKVYCIDGYVSGLSVGANRLRSECWSDDGEPLADFSQVDRIGILLTSAREDIAFDYCVTDVTLDAPVEDSRVLIGDFGKLSGAMNGYAWVAAAQQAELTRPVPCDRSGCFKSTGGKLCTAGSMPALECTGQGTPGLSCNWRDNWGVMIGMNPKGEGEAWGEQAAERVSVVYSGTPGTYRLTAHVAGDPHDQNYCIDNYRSGSEVSAEMFRTSCWNESGTPLASLASIDSLALMLASQQDSVDFDYCVTSISAI